MYVKDLLLPTCMIWLGRKEVILQEMMTPNALWWKIWIVAVFAAEILQIGNPGSF